jgi:uncharacterized membrane protein
MNNLPFTRKNYQLMVTGIIVLVIGLVIMTLDTEPYGFGFVGLTLGPIVVLAGFVIELVAILYRAPEQKR